MIAFFFFFLFCFLVLKNTKPLVARIYFSFSFFTLYTTECFLAFQILYKYALLYPHVFRDCIFLYFFVRGKERERRKGIHSHPSFFFFFLPPVFSILNMVRQHCFTFKWQPKKKRYYYSLSIVLLGFNTSACCPSCKVSLFSSAFLCLYHAHFFFHQCILFVQWNERDSLFCSFVSFFFFSYSFIFMNSGCSTLVIFHSLPPLCLFTYFSSKFWRSLCFPLNVRNRSALLFRQ